MESDGSMSPFPVYASLPGLDLLIDGDAAVANNPVGDELYCRYSFMKGDLTRYASRAISSPHHGAPPMPPKAPESSTRLATAPERG
jgi:hypothetical protein